MSRVKIVEQIEIIRTINRRSSHKLTDVSDNLEKGMLVVIEQQLFTIGDSKIARIGVKDQQGIILNSVTTRSNMILFFDENSDKIFLSSEELPLNVFNVSKTDILSKKDVCIDEKQFVYKEQSSFSKDSESFDDIILWIYECNNDALLYIYKENGHYTSQYGSFISKKLVSLFKTL